MEYDYLIEKEDWDTTDENIIHNLSSADRAFFAEKVKYYDGILVDLSYDKCEIVRLGVAKNRKTPVRTLKRMAVNDSVVEVSKAAKNTLKELGV